MGKNVLTRTGKNFAEIRCVFLNDSSMCCYRSNVSYGMGKSNVEAGGRPRVSGAGAGKWSRNLAGNQSPVITF